MPLSLAKIIKIPHLLLLHIKLKTHGVEYGKKIRGNRVVLRNKGHIKIGNNVSLNSHPDGDPHRTGLQCHCKEAMITIGDNCNLNGTMIHCRTAVKIGSHGLFGPGSQIVDNDSHRTSIDITERRKPPMSAPIHIGNNVWVGMHALILKGVTIGNNSVIAANSVVTKNIPENVLAVGIPARAVKTLTM